MVNILALVVAIGPTYVKVANMPGLYRHARNGRYYACKKLGGASSANAAWARVTARSLSAA